MAAVELYRQLKKLGCPALEGVNLSEPEDIQQLLCTPSSHRLDILEWICISVYPPLQEHFSSLNESQIDVKIKGMAKMGSDLMLCHADDLDLIEGKASAQKQLCFLERLVAVILSLRSFEISGCGSASSTFSSCLFRDPRGFTPFPWSPSQKEAIREMAKTNARFLKQVFYSPDLQAVLNPECHPLGSDVKALLWNEEARQKRSRLLVVSQETTLLELSKELEETAAALQGVQAQCAFLHGSPAGAEQRLDGATVMQTIKLVVSDFSQMLVAFGQLYENELQKHCECPAPQLSPCGPLFKAVHQDLCLCIQELKSLAQVTETSTHIVNQADQGQVEKLAWRGSTKATLPSKLEELRQKYKAIQAKLHQLPLILNNTQETPSP